MTKDMRVSEAGLDLLRQWEKLELIPYQDESGVWTDGYGNTHGVVPGIAISETKANNDLLRNAQDAVECVNDYVTVPLAQHQFDATAVFVFNIGIGAFMASTFLRKLNAGDYQGAHDELDRWNKVKGRVSNGLIRRRDAEQALWDTPDAA